MRYKFEMYGARNLRNSEKRERIERGLVSRICSPNLPAGTATMVVRQRGIPRVLPALLVLWAPSLASAFGRLGNLFTRQATARALEEDEPECADSADPGAAQCKIWADAGERRQQPSQCTTSGGSSR